MPADIMKPRSTGVLLAHPGCGPFIQQVGRALHESGNLAGFLTTISYRPDLPRWKIWRRLARLAGLDLDRLLANRQIHELPDGLVSTNGWRELLRTGVNRFDSDGRLTDLLWEWGELAFDRWAARQVRPGLAAVYGYEHAALNLFRQAKSLNIPRIYELPAPATGFVDDMFAQEYEKFPEIQNPYTHHIKQHQGRRRERRRQESELADLIVVNSSLTRDSYVAQGIDAKKMHVIPLGAPPVSTAPRQSCGDSLRIVWAGTFSIRKGAHHLLAAWRLGGLERHDVVLDVFGTPALPERLLSKAPGNIRFHGPVPQTELYSSFLRADLLILPTLCDGFGMVITEAMAHGLPALTTRNAGAAELIRHGENGLLAPAGDIGALSTALLGLLDAREDLVRMGVAARETAAAWQWSDFRLAHRRIIEEFLRKNSS